MTDNEFKLRKEYFLCRLRELIMFQPKIHDARQQIRLPKSLKEKIELRARVEGLDQAEIIRRAIEAYL